MNLKSTQQKITKNGRKRFKWIAHYWAPQVFGRPYQTYREIWAVNEFQARKKAEGIAKKDGLKFISLGRL
jgi:hypothetical protein